MGVDSNHVSSAGSTTQTQCQGSQMPNAQESTCVNCDQAGFYVNGGVCHPVDLGYVSAADTTTQTKCTGTNIPNGDKSACTDSGCPLHFIPVPKLAGYTTANFCVAKYEMKNDGSGNALSKAASLPWANITRANAITKCQAKGSGYDLIINNEWQTLARNIELVNTNWDSGQVGSGKLNTGRTSAPLAASSDDLQACHGTGQTCDATTVWHTQRRTHILSNGLAVWDLGSSVGEWIKQNDKKAFPEVAFGENSIRVFTGDEKFAFGPQGSYTSNVGLGGNITAYGGDIYRGGVHSGVTPLTFESGIFTVSDTVQGTRANNYKGGKHTAVGFRCVYHPTFSISSVDFNHNRFLHNDFSHNQGSVGSKKCNGKNDFPQLRWTKAPTGTQSFVLIVDDPDASGGGTWVHLNLFNILSSTTEIPRITAASFVATFPSGTLGMSDWDVGHATTTWGGPCPPNTSTPSADTHSYHFKI